MGLDGLHGHMASTISNCRFLLGVSVSEEIELIKAHLEVLESVLMTIARRDPSVIDEVRGVLREGYLSSLEIANRRDEAGFPQAIHYQMRAPRNTLGEQAKVEAYKALCTTFGVKL